MENILCPLCCSRSAKLKEALKENSFYLCNDCGAEFCFPMRASPAEFYAFDYGAAGKGYGKENKWEFQKFASDVRKFNLHGNLIDIGCGPGEFLKVATQVGFNVFGIDFNQLTIEKAKSLGFGNARVGSISDIPNIFAHSLFDVAVMFHVLEHLEDPISSLNVIKSTLTPGGVLAIAVPNSERSFLKINPRSRREGWDYLPQHLTRWNKHSLSKFLSDQGFVVFEIVEERIESVKQNFEFLMGFFHFLTSTGAVARVKNSQFRELERGHKRGLTLRLLKMAAFIKVVLLQIPVLILFPFFYLLSRFLFIKGVNLYVLARKL